jgi:hypothetical protein
MPGLTEIKTYLTGLWLLFLQKPEGFRYLDISPRGVGRSFMAIPVCLPFMLIGWIWWHSVFLEAMPPGSQTGVIFFIRLFLVDMLDWIVPLILIGLFTLAMQVPRAFARIVVVSNWITVPFSLSSGLLSLLSLILPSAHALWTLLWLVQLTIAFIALYRVMRMVMGGQTLLAATTTILLIVPSLILGDVLQTYLGVAIA